MTRIFATRPQKQNKAWAKRLREAGFEVCELPMLSIEPLRVNSAQARARELIQKLDEYQKVIFISQNAVDFAFEQIDMYWSQLPRDINWYAVGNATRSLLEDHLDALHCVVLTNAAMNTEALLELPDFNAPLREKILICRGVGGRAKLGDELRVRGARVDYCELYERATPADGAVRVRSAKLDPADVLCIFSGETLKNFHSAIVSAGDANAAQCRIIVPGDRVAELARELGFSKISVAENASDKAMLAAIENE